MISRLMKTTRVFVLMMAALLFGVLDSSAQVLNSNSGNAFKDNWAIQFQPGFSQFYGDATNHNYFQKLKGEIGLYGDLSVRKMIIPAVGVGVDFAYVGLKSYKDRRKGVPVDYHLSGSYYDAGLFVYVNFIHLFAGYKPDRRFTAYGTIGAGWGFWNSALTDGITGLTVYSGSQNGSYKYKTNAMVVPVSLGVNWRLSDRWSVNLGGTLRTVFSDDVDVWHDGFKYDQIFSTNVGITYHLRAGWGRGSKRSRPSKKSPCCNEKQEKTKPVIPIYGFDQINVTPAPTKPAKQPRPIDMMSVKKKSAKPEVQRIEFRVQIMATTKPLNNVTALQMHYHLPYPVVETHQNGFYRYSVGSFKSFSEALAASKEVRRLGVAGAFVVAYRNGYRIPITAKMKKAQSPSSVIF